VILVDPNHPSCKKDFGWMIINRKRAYRGLTSAQRKGRGLRAKGKGGEKRNL